MRFVRTIAMINQKGGVGKTTTVANLGAAIATAGHKICLLDLDPQSNLTLHLGIDPRTTQHSIYDVLEAREELNSIALKVSSNLWVVPSTIDLAAAEVELAGTVGREQILRDSLLSQPLPYEYMMIDCPPSLGLLTLNALAAADEVVIPLQPHFLALQGLGRLLETVELVQRRINPALEVSGIILCLYETTTRLASEVLADLREFFTEARSKPCSWARTRIFQTIVRRNIKLAECPSYGKTIFEYAPNSHGAEDYSALAVEFLEHLAGRAIGPNELEEALAISSEKKDSTIAAATELKNQNVPKDNSTQSPHSQQTTQPKANGEIEPSSDADSFKSSVENGAQAL